MHFLIAAAALAHVPSPREVAADRMVARRNEWEACREDCARADKRGRLTVALLEELDHKRTRYQEARTAWQKETDDTRKPTDGAALESEIRTAAVDLELVQVDIATKGETATRSKRRDTCQRKLDKLLSARPAPAENADEYGIQSPEDAVDPTPAENLRRAFAELSAE